MKHFLILSFVIISFGANAQKFRQEIQDYNSVVNLRNETLAPKKNDKAFIQTTKHLYSYDLGNTTSPDDGLKYIVQTLGSYRWVCLNCHLRVELSQDSILLQYDANDILVSRDTIRLTGGGPDKFSTNIVATTPYDDLNPLTGWVAPTNPIEGNTVEVQFTDGTVVNYTWDGTTWIPKFLESWGEKRICLNTATPSFIPSDPNNPTIAEVEVWKNANLSLLDQQNGTILTYFVDGDGGSCDIPDYTWTLNKGSELITLDNKREYNGRVHYIADKGNDAQGLVGYPHNPYKDFYTTLSNANFLNGDVAHVRKGNFISTTEIPVIDKDIKVYLEEGSVIESVGGHFLGVNNLTYVYNSADTSNISVQGSGEIIHRPTSLTRMFYLPYNSDLNVKLKKLTLLAGANQAWGISLRNRKAIVHIDEVIANNNKLVCSFDSWATLPNSELPSIRDVFIKTIKVTNQTSRANIIRIQPGNMADNSIDNIHIDNIYFDNTNILSGTLYFQSNMISDINGYVVNATFDNIVNNRLSLPAYTDYNMISAIGSELALGGQGTNAFKYNNLSMNLLVNNVVSNASIVALSFMRYNNSNIKITVKNGVSTTVPFYIGGPTLENNTIINLDMNLQAKTSPVGIFAYPSIDSTSKIKITGTYKTLHPGVATFQIASGSISDALILENCSLINDGTVPNITTNSTTPITIICKNVYMNSLTLDPNINLVGTFYQNINYK